MGYTADVKYLWEIIDEIADELIALPEWEEGDATWDTTDKTDMNARRVVHHIADDVYLSLIAGNTLNGIKHETGTYDNYWKGLIIVFSSGWDGVAHEPDGSKYYSFAPFEGSYRYTVGTDMAILDVDYRLFTSAKGFALVGVPAPTGSADQSAFIFVVERNASKLYADGFTNFYIFIDGNRFLAAVNTTQSYIQLFGEYFKWWRYSRPFTLQSQSGYEFPYDAIKSSGDDKAYFTKPILHNDGNKLSPIFQAEMFISVTNARGLGDDDEITLNGKKYQVTIKQSPKTTTYMKYAIAKAE